MHARLALPAIVAATLGLTCQATKKPAQIDPPKAVATSISSSAISTTSPNAPPKDAGLSRAFIALRDMSQSSACLLSANNPPVQAHKGAKPFEQMEGSCEGSFCDTVDVAPKGANACYVSNDHIKSAERKAKFVGTIQSGTNSTWDGKKMPKYFDRIDAHLHLDENEKSLLRKNGFVVLDRLAYSNYAHAFHDVFQEQLPLYVGIDPILHALFLASDVTLGQAEQMRLAPALDKMLAKLRKGLTSSKGIYDEETRQDLDMYLGIAARLAEPYNNDDKPISVLGRDSEVKNVYDTLWTESGLLQIDIFGRTRMIDMSQYVARGHYTYIEVNYSGASYFHAMTWLSRFEWNLVSRDSRSSHPDASPDKRETPREARDALALADLFRRTGALTELAAFEEVYSGFGGKREDIGILDLLKLMDEHHFKPNDPEAPDKLKSAIGDHFKRTARTHFMPQGVTDLPAISTVIGARITPDIAPLENLVHDAIPNRFDLGAADVGYLLGHDRAAMYLQDELARYPALKSALDSSRAKLAQEAKQDTSVHGSFLHSLAALAEPPTGLIPSFMKHDAFADYRLSSALVGYGQLRHTFVLLSGQGYDAYGCAIPESYVEPATAFYTAAREHVKRLQKIAGKGFNGLSRVLDTLSNITKTELARGAPTKDQAHWLGMVAEYIPEGGYSDSGEPPKWTGWYFDMFEDREQGATKAADFIADYFTLTNSNQVAYLGTDGPRLGVFVVDTGGEPRAFVGPVARGYESKAPLTNRLDDAAARTAENKDSRFRASFAAKPWTEPAIGLGVELFHCSIDGKLEIRVLTAANRPPGPVTITLLDHHGDPLTPPLTRNIEDQIVAYSFVFPEVPADKEDPSPPTDYPPPGNHPIKYLVEAISIRIEDLKHSQMGTGPYDYFTSPSVFFGKGDYENLPLRNVGTFPSFVIGGQWSN